MLLESYCSHRGEELPAVGPAFCGASDWLRIRAVMEALGDEECPPRYGTSNFGFQFVVGGGTAGPAFSLSLVCTLNNLKSE